MANWRGRGFSLSIPVCFCVYCPWPRLHHAVRFVLFCCFHNLKFIITSACLLLVPYPFFQLNCPRIRQDLYEMIKKRIQCILLSNSSCCLLGASVSTDFYSLVRAMCKNLEPPHISLFFCFQGAGPLCSHLQAFWRSFLFCSFSVQTLYHFIGFVKPLNTDLWLIEAEKWHLTKGMNQTT